MVDYFKSTEVVDDQAYDYFCSVIDVDSFIDYFVFETYSANLDWPGTNMMMWKYAGEKIAGNKYTDGKVRMVLHDLDDAFLFPYHNTVEYIFNENWIEPDTEEEPATDYNLKNDYNCDLIRRLITNDKFRTRFLSRFIEISNTVFEPSYVVGRIDEAAAAIDTEIEDHLLRWRFSDSVITEIYNGLTGRESEKDLYSAWKNNVDLFKKFAEKRPYYIDKYLTGYFGEEYTDLLSEYQNNYK